MKKIIIIALIPLSFAIILFSGCDSEKNNNSVIDRSYDSSAPAAGYKMIDQDTAKEMMTKNDGHIIVDVRRQDEYDEGHIPGAVLIPNETIGNEKPEELPDTDQIILIYCRSGNRSKDASKKLADMGYTNIYEFGGINTWTGEIVSKDDDTES